MICGLYQLFGHYFETIDGTRLDGAFIACFVFLILTMATGFAACIMKLGKKK